jgi:hypothetical protein
MMMSTPNLLALDQELKNIPQDKVQPPPIPADKLAAEGVAVALAAEQDRAGLLAAGLTAEMMDRLMPAAHALAEAEAVVRNQRRKERTSAELALEQEAHTLRADVLAECDHAVRKDPDGKAVLSRVREGDGLDDLVQDLRDLGVFLSSRASQVTAVGVDAGARAAQVKDMASRLEETVAGRRTSASAERAAYDARDRAATYLWEALVETRETAAFVFRKDPERAAQYRSAYLARKRRRSAKTEVEV